MECTALNLAPEILVDFKRLDFLGEVLFKLEDLGLDIESLTFFTGDAVLFADLGLKDF